MPGKESNSSKVLAARDRLLLELRRAMRGVCGGSDADDPYKSITSSLVPLALEHYRRTFSATSERGSNPPADSRAAATVGVVSPGKKSLTVSLDQELEWQRMTSTHSPRTPTMASIMKALRESPPPSPRPEWTGEESVASGEPISKELVGVGCKRDVSKDIAEHPSLEFLFKLARACREGVGLRLVDQLIHFPDGSVCPLNTQLPIAVQTVDVDSSSVLGASSVNGLSLGSPCQVEIGPSGTARLDIGSLWLAVAAKHVYYESEIVRLIRARKHLLCIYPNDRAYILRFLNGNSSYEELTSSRLWVGQSNQSVIAPKADLAEDKAESERETRIGSLEKQLTQSKSTLTALSVKLKADRSREVSSTVASLLKKLKPSAAPGPGIQQQEPSVSSAVSGGVRADIVQASVYSDSAHHPQVKAAVPSVAPTEARMGDASPKARTGDSVSILEEDSDSLNEPSLSFADETRLSRKRALEVELYRLNQNKRTAHYRLQALERTTKWIREQLSREGIPVGDGNS